MESPFRCPLFLEIQSQLKNPSKDAALWVGIAALSLQNDPASRGKQLKWAAASEIARYALGEISRKDVLPSLKEFYDQSGTLPEIAEVRKDLDQRVQKANLLPNKQLLQSNL